MEHLRSCYECRQLLKVPLTLGDERIRCPSCKAFLYLCSCARCDKSMKTFKLFHQRSRHKRGYRQIASSVSQTSDNDEDDYDETQDYDGLDYCDSVSNPSTTHQVYTSIIELPPRFVSISWNQLMSALLFGLRISHQRKRLILSFLSMLTRTDRLQLQFWGLEKHRREIESWYSTVFGEKLTRPMIEHSDGKKIRITSLAIRAAIGVANGSAKTFNPSDLCEPGEPPLFQKLSIRPTTAVFLILFADKYAKVRFIGKQLYAVYGFFIPPQDRQKVLFEVAHFPGNYESLELYNPLLATILNTIHDREFKFNDLTFQIVPLFIVADLPGRIGIRECPGFQAQIGGCPACHATLHEQQFYADERLFLTPRRQFLETHPLFPYFRNHQHNVLPTDPMHCLYLGITKRLIESFIADHEIWNESISRHLRSSILDQGFSKFAISQRYKSNQPLLGGEQTVFRAMDWKMICGISCKLKKYLKQEMGACWIWFLAFVSIIEASGLEKGLAGRTFRQMARIWYRAGITFCPNIHCMMHLAEEADTHGLCSFREADRFEALNKVSREFIKNSNSQSPTTWLIEESEKSASIEYLFETIFEEYSNPEQADYSLRKSMYRYFSSHQSDIPTIPAADGVFSNPAENSNPSSPPVFFDPIKIIFYLRTGIKLVPKGYLSLPEQLEAKGYFVLQSSTEQVSASAEPFLECLGKWVCKEGLWLFYLSPFTPGWQPSPLIKICVNYLFDSFTLA